jgi:magnesium-protoporphyrin IX monomethyl ester (oxidative) cyclase
MKKIESIMLIQPPVTRPLEFSAKNVRVSPFFPLGLAYLAAYLEKSGKYEIHILDALAEGDIDEGTLVEDGKKIRYGLSDEDIAEKIRQCNPGAIGVSCLFASLEKDMATVCRIAKEVNPEIVTIAGGHHVGSMPAGILELYPPVDFAVKGEGEETLIDILDAVNEENFNTLDGVTFREKEEIKTIPKTKFIMDIDSIPFPARHLFNMQRYFDIAKSHGFSSEDTYTQMVNTRGCPCKCTFCTLAAPDGVPISVSQRRRSVDNILEEIEQLQKVYGIKEIHFEDDNLTADKKWAAELFDGMTKRKFDVKWHVPSGMAAYTMSDELIAKMKASGCNAVTIAIESGNQHVLDKLMRKPLRLKTIPSLVKNIRKHGIDIRAFFLLGFPGETKDNMRETLEYARNLELDWCVFSVTSPLPGTKIYDICVEKGYIDLEDFDLMTSFHKCIITTPEFTPEFVHEFKEEAIIDVCFRNNPNLLKYDIDKAITNFKDVVTNYPHFDFANFYLGEAYLKKGNREAAIEYYENTIKITPDHQDAKARLEDLARGLAA